MSIRVLKILYNDLISTSTLFQIFSFVLTFKVAVSKIVFKNAVP